MSFNSLKAATNLKQQLQKLAFSYLKLKNKNSSIGLVTMNSDFISGNKVE